MSDFGQKYTIQLGFEEIKLPPYEDILIIGKRCPHGKIGISKSLDFLVPNEFEIIEVKDDKIEAILVNKKILRKIDANTILNVLRKRVFSYISDCEIIKVEFKLKVSYDLINIEAI